MEKTIEYKIYSARFEAAFNKELSELSTENVISRLWEHDYTLWEDSPEEITNRLDWLELPETMSGKISELNIFAQSAVDEGFTSAVLLGMGGSSLAPDVFQRIFNTQPSRLSLSVLDTTDATAIALAAQNIEIEHTLFIVSTKSGGTVETLSLFKYFYNLTMEKVGEQKAGSHFIAITDPGSPLVKLADEYHFRKTFLNNPNIGGRYSALSYFGIVPATLIGIDTEKMLLKTAEFAKIARQTPPTSNNLAAQIGALVGVAANQSTDKLTFISDDNLSPLEDWIEQLIAESTGKSGHGILPVAREAPPSDFSLYGKDRIFVIISLNENPQLQQIAQKLIDLGHPVIQITLHNFEQLGSLMYLWEVATAIVGRVIKIHPFNQPNVEAAKKLARKSVQTYKETGSLPKTDALPYSANQVIEFLQSASEGSYIALQAFVPPAPKTEKAFRALQAALRDKYQLAVTFGFGPRFLHSTGQLHKGDAGKGYFLQFRTASSQDIPIPETAGESESFISFDILKHAQAIGDAQALRQENRKVLALDLEENPINQINDLTQKLTNHG